MQIKSRTGGQVDWTVLTEDLFKKAIEEYAPGLSASYLEQLRQNGTIIVNDVRYIITG